MATLPKTPNGETLEKVRGLMRKADGSPKMRRAIAAAIKAMGLPAPLPTSDKAPAEKSQDKMNG